MSKAKILPCNVLCEECANEMIEQADQNTREIECKACEEIHSIPEKGFKVWKALDEFNSEKMNIKEIYRGEAAEKLKSNLKDIEENILVAWFVEFHKFYIKL